MVLKLSFFTGAWLNFSVRIKVGTPDHHLRDYLIEKMIMSKNSPKQVYENSLNLNRYFNQLITNQPVEKRFFDTHEISKEHIINQLELIVRNEKSFFTNPTRRFNINYPMSYLDPFGGTALEYRAEEYKEINLGDINLGVVIPREKKSSWFSCFSTKKK